jgi:hypothetical protein
MGVTEPVDLDALDAAYAKPHDPHGKHPLNDVFRNLTDLHDALHNAYPAMAAELRERRAREGATVRLLRDALESLVALRQGYVAYLEIAIENGEVDEVNECEGDEETIATADVRIDAIEQVLAKKGGV